jgi:Mrp family chromosome partitioning ATPase
MFRKRSHDEGFAQPAPLALRAADGAPLVAFAPEIVDSFRHMVTELQYGGGFPARLATVAALRGEGVTFSTLALAATLASDDPARVCAVELNWWAPGMLRLLGGAAPRPGLADVLLGRLELNDALLATDRPNLALLPAGSLPPDQRPAAARGERLRTLIEELGARFDHLVLDIPAVLATSDAIALASLGTACCVVVRYGVTPTGAVQSALDDLKHLPQLGVILNQARIRTPRWLRALVPQE